MNHSINTKVFLNRIKHLRILKGISQQKMADLLHVDLRTYTRFERGENKTMDISFLSNIAKVLDTDLISMLGTRLSGENINKAQAQQLDIPETEEELPGRDQIIKHYVTLLMHKDMLIKELYELIDKLKQSNSK